MNKDFEHDRLIEALTIERSLSDAIVMPYDIKKSGYSTIGYTWHPPKAAGKFDIVYKNKEGKYHRIYGPAYVSLVYDLEIWYKDGKYHREDGPAIRHRNNVIYFKNGLLHRLDGPAIVHTSGPKQYWIDGIKYTRKQYIWEITRRQEKIGMTTKKSKTEK